MISSSSFCLREKSVSDQTTEFSFRIHRHYAMTHKASLMTHFLFLKMQLNAKHATAKTMPAVAKMAKTIVRERSTDTCSCKGTPSYGISPPGRWRENWM